jgi:hypothetical protein
MNSQPPFGYKRIAERQLVGTSGGFAVFRDLYENDAGDRVSIPVSREFEMQRERTIPGEYPSEDVIFQKHRL